MAKSTARSRDERQAAKPQGLDAVDSFEQARPWLLGVAAMLFVARPLIPSVNVEHQGNDAPFVMLWLLLVAITLVLAWRAGRAVVHWSAVDKVLLLVVSLHSASALFAVWSGAAPRPAINMLWTWIGYGAAFAIVRQLLRHPAEARALAAVMIALAVVSCGYALYEYFVSQPATAAEYARNPDAALRASGQWYPPGSRERYLFEQRLGSTEPVATFALTNSLAGFLVAWLMVIAGSLMVLPERVAARGWMLTTFAALGIVLLVVLLLTKSRSAMVGAGVGLAFLGASGAGRKHLLSRRALIVSVVLLLAVGAAVAIGGLDLAMIGEAPKSLAFRLEYWQATWNMIVSQPIWGVGPGEFKDAYTAYKLPTASEEISDPHNFLLEVWATAGTATAAALTVFLGSVLLGALRKTDKNKEVPAAQQLTAPAPTRSVGEATNKILAGGMCGWLLAFLLPYFAGPVIEVPLTLPALLGGLLVGGVTLFALWPWIVAGALPEFVPAVAMLALLVNMLAAGGIGHPGVAGTLMLLAALATTDFSLDRAAHHTSRERVATYSALAVGMGLALALTASAAVTLYHPVVRSHLEIAAARTEPRLAFDHLAAAAEADTWGHEAPRYLAQLAFENWRRHPTEQSHQLFIAATQRWLDRRPGSSEAWNQAAAWRTTVFEQTAEQSDAVAAMDAYRQAVSLYPNHGVRRARLALAAAAAGETSLANEQAAEALRLDGLMPHTEQKLNDELRREMERMAPGGSSGT